MCFNVDIFTDQDQSDGDSDDESEYKSRPLYNDNSSDDDFSYAEALN